MGIAIGAGAALVAREILPSFRKALRPLVKAGLASGVVLLERGRETVARWGEDVEDMLAEVRMEHDLERSASAPPDEPSN
jgi:hypothetical protein